MHTKDYVTLLYTGI